jgi:hypothetical protein
MVYSVGEGEHIGELGHAAENALVGCVRTETKPSWLTVKYVAVQRFGQTLTWSTLGGSDFESHNQRDTVTELHGEQAIRLVAELQG